MMTDVEMTDAKVCKQVERADRFIEQTRDAITATVVDPASLAAATLPFSPYFLTDVFARASLAELSAWAVFPWVLFFFVKFCREPRGLTGLSLILSAALFIMCHKIFLAWGAIMLVVFGLPFFGWRRMLTLT
jgi:hypothetical protein